MKKNNTKRMSFLTAQKLKKMKLKKHLLIKNDFVILFQFCNYFIQVAKWHIMRKTALWRIESNNPI